MSASTLCRLRAVLLWVAVTAVGAVLARLAADTLTSTTRLGMTGGAAALDRSFDQLLGAAGALALAAACGWGWVATTVVVARVAARPDATQTRTAGVPRWLQRLLLTACGAALAGGLALPAHAEPGAVGTGSPGAPAVGALAGLPLPERATASPPPHAVHVVRRGDSLWAIAEARLPGDATDAEIIAAWRAVHHANRAVVGADPDLIHPAQRLRLPRL